jgi:hypothetical protein
MRDTFVHHLYLRPLTTAITFTNRMTFLRMINLNLVRQIAIVMML